MSKRGDWSRVGKGKPCPICLKEDWCLEAKKQVRGKTLILCMRQNLGAYKTTIIDGHPAYHHYIDSNLHQNLVSYEKIIEIEIASTKNRDFVYRLLFNGCLKQHHKRYYRLRHIPEIQAKQSLYTSVPSFFEVNNILNKLLQNKCDLLGVPGFWEEYDKWKLNIIQGIYLPVLNQDGLIVGAQINTEDAITAHMLYTYRGFDIPEDKKPFAKYIWLSSAPEQKQNKKGQWYTYRKNGVGAEAAAHFSARKDSIEANKFYDVNKDIIVVEGVFKANTVQYLTNQDVIGQPGVGISTNNIITAIQNKNGCKVIIAYDADWKTNLNVKLALGWLLIRIRGVRNGLGNIFVKTWDIKYGKGYDDVLLQNNNDKCMDIPAEQWLKDNNNTLGQLEKL